MAGARQSADAARSAVGDALVKGRRKVGGGVTRPAAGPRALMAMQRAAGNSAVTALMAARLRWPDDQARSEIDGGVRELKKDEPNVDTLEKGLKAAKALGVPVDLEGVRPPASALAVTTTGFGPGQVAAKKPVPPKEPVPAKSPLGKVAAKPAKPPGGGPGAAPAGPQITGGAARAEAPVALSGAQLLQPPVRPPGVAPESDPAFTNVTKNVKNFAKAKKAHPPAALKAKEAQDAALAPSDDLTSQAKAGKADTMDAQQAGSFDQKAFIAAVKAAIEAKSPKTLKEADEYKKSGKAKEVKGEVKGLVTQGKEGQAKDIESATAAPPDPSKAVAKPVTPMGPEQPGATVPIPAQGAVPKPAPAEQLNLEAGKHEANQEMAGGEVTEDQLAESNEPQFEQALEDKKAAAEHADKAPGEYRQQEQQVIEQGKTDAGAETQEGVAGMQGAKTAALAKVVADKGKTKSKDEQKRAEVTARIQAIFNATEAEVQTILDGIDPKVEKAFEVGEADARQKFESFVSAKMSAYKKDRYGGWTGKFRWLRDKIKGMPSKVNEFYEAGRELYLKQMDRVIAGVAEIVGKDLTAAKKRIATGKNEISTYVTSLPKNLQKVGAEASNEIGERFEQLESDVNSKQESVVDTLATKYVAARKGLDERIEELQAENRGLIDKAIGAIKAIINTIRELVAMLKNVLSRVAGVVGQIIKAPVKFLGNLIDGIKSGINRFKENFVDHLRKGLLSWLFGALAEGGVELPETLDVKGVIKLLASLFGLTWRNIRSRIVNQIGEKAMAAVETSVDIFQKLASPGGVGALWEMLLEKLGDIKEMILEKVKDFVLTRIITAGITWLISLLNPAAAFIKACKLIYDVVMFFVSNASRIAKFVNTILDSVSDIVRGNISGVAAKIENVLSQMIPIIIGFLASLVSLGGIGQKVREIVQKLQKPFTQALDMVIKTGLKLAGPVIRAVAGIAGKVKGKIASGKAWAKGKVDAVKEKMLRRRREDSVAPAVAAASGLLAAKGATVAGVRDAVPTMRSQFGLTRAELVPRGGLFHIHVQKADTPDMPLVAGTQIEEAKKYRDRKFVVTASHRVATVTDVHEEGGFVFLKYDLSRTIGGTSQHGEGSVTMKVAEFLDNIKNGGPALVPAAGGPDQTKYTLDRKNLRPEYLDDVRRYFYKFGYKRHRGAKMAEVAQPDGTFVCPGWGRASEPERRTAHKAPQAEGQLDHKNSVAGHWKTDGHKTSQAVREAFDTDRSNLQMLCGKCNREKSSYDEAGAKGTYTPVVEIPNFSGPGGVP